MLLPFISRRPPKGADVASATALPILTDGNAFDVTGTTTITSINTSGHIGTVITLHFDGILTLTHNATDLVLPGAANITTAAGDEAIFVEYASGDWRCVNYQVSANAPDGGGIIKAWFSYNQITPTVNDSLNISSITDTSTGLFTANFTSSFSNALYQVNGSGGAYNASASRGGTHSGMNLGTTDANDDNRAVGSCQCARQSASSGGANSILQDGFNQFNFMS